MERGQNDGDEANGEDLRLLSAYWQERFERLEEEAAKAKLEAAKAKLEAAEVKQLKEQLERSEMDRQQLLEELLRPTDSTEPPNDEQERPQFNPDYHNISHPTPQLP